MSLPAGSKVYYLIAGDTWERGVAAKTEDGVDHIDVLTSAVFDATYTNYFDKDGVAITTPITETLEPVRYEASVQKIVVTSGIVRLIRS